jgi:hypothetical protein
VHTFTIKSYINQQAISDVLLEAQLLLGGSYVTIQQAVTDGSGLAYMNLNPFKEYRVILTKNGYTQTIQTTIPEQVAYNYFLTPTTTTYPFLDDVNYLIQPNTQTLGMNTTTTIKGFVSGTSITQSSFKITFSNGTTIYSTTNANPTGTTFTYNLFVPYNTSNTYVVVNLSYIKDGVTNSVYQTYNLYFIVDDSFKDKADKFSALNDTNSKILKFFFVMLLILVIMILGRTMQIDYSNISLLVVPFMLFFAWAGFVDWITASISVIVLLIFYIGGQDK